MKPVLSLFRPLQNAWQVFFARDLRLHRGEAGLEIVLAERPRATQPAQSREDKARAQERAELALMHEQLRAVLDELPGTRQTLRHLVFVEQALLRKGWRALHKLPLEVLQRALEQLEGLVTNWSPVGLATLRSKIAVAVIDREHMDPNAEADAYRTAMPLETTLPMPLPEGTVVAEVAMPDAGGDDEAALAAAYAAMGVAAPELAVPVPAPTPAQIAAQTLAQARLGSAAAAAGSSGAGAGEPLEYHNELGSRAAKAQPRENLAGAGKLPPLKLRELQE